jgi:DNA-binding NarL/FixJ family response regulator
MRRPRRCRVLLLSRAPHAHSELIVRLRRRGAEVRIPGSAERALALLDAGPDFLLVDLVHGAGLTPHLVDHINRQRAATVVLALHDGSFGRYHDEALDLSVEGFCHARASRPLARAIARAPWMNSVAVH